MLTLLRGWPAAALLEVRSFRRYGTRLRTGSRSRETHVRRVRNQRGSGRGASHAVATEPPVGGRRMAAVLRGHHRRRGPPSRSRDPRARRRGHERHGRQGEDQRQRRHHLGAAGARPRGLPRRRPRERHRGHRAPEPRGAACERVPRPRPPLRQHRPARDRVRRGARARAGELRPRRGRPHEHVLHGRHERPARARDLARDRGAPAGDVLQLHRSRVHPHRGARAASVAPAADGVDAQPRVARPPRAAPYPHEAHRGRDPRAVHPQELRRPQALLARGRREHDPDDRSARRGLGPARHRGSRHRHGPPRSPQRAGQRHGQERARDLRRVRRQAPGALLRRRRREVPPRLLERGDDAGPPAGAPVDGVQPEPPRVGRPRRRGPRPREDRSQEAQEHHAAAPPRRRGVHGPGHRRRDAESRRPRGVHDGRHRPPHREQPDRLHDGPQGFAVDPLLLRHGAHAARAGLPRERRGPSGRHPGHAPGDRVPSAVQAGRRHRHVLLPQVRPQRGRRAALHPAAHVRAHRQEADGPRGLRLAPARRRQHHARRGRRHRPGSPRLARARARGGPPRRLPPDAGRHGRRLGPLPRRTRRERPRGRHGLPQGKTAFGARQAHEDAARLPPEPQGAQDPRAAARAGDERASRSTGGPASTSRSRRCSSRATASV